MNANIWRIRQKVKRKNGARAKIFAARWRRATLRLCKAENKGVIDWRIVRRELVVARIKAGLEEDALAKAIGIDVSTVYRIEKANSTKHNPSLDIIAGWVEACGLTLVEFVAIVERERAGPLVIVHQMPDDEYENGKSGEKFPNIAALPPDSTILNIPQVPVQAVLSGSAGVTDGTAGTVQADRGFDQAVLDFKEATQALEEAADILRDIATGSLLPKPRKKTRKTRGPSPKGRQQARTPRR